MNLLAFTYFPMPIIIGSGGNVSNLPPYANGIMIACFLAGFGSLICLLLTMVFDFVFDRKHVSNVFIKSAVILCLLTVVLLGISFLCALIGV